MSHTTTKWGLIVPDETDVDDVPSWIDQLAQKLDITIAGFKADTWANRPTGAGLIDGLIFWATDTGNFYLIQGGILHNVNPQVGLVGDITISGFADAAAAGASGRFADASHRHGREANPLPAHTAAADPHAQYAFDTDLTAQTASIVAALANGKEPVWPGATPTLFVAAPPGADGAVHMYTVPAGKVAIIRKAEITPSGNVTGLFLYLADGAGFGWGGVAVVNKSLGQGQAIEFDGFYVLPAGSFITVATSGGTYGSCWMNVSGVLMNVPATGPAPILICNNYTVAGDNTLYTVPAGKTLVVLTAIVTEIGGVATMAELRIGAAPAMLPWGGQIAANEAIQSDGFWVVNSGNTVAANVGGDAGSHVVFTLSGVLI